MGLLDIFSDDDTPNHKVKDGDKKDWKASEFSDDYWVDDEWIKNNTKEAD